MAEHSATNALEYERVRCSGPRGEMVRFVYDVPELVYEGEPPRIFKRRSAASGGGGGGGAFETDPSTHQKALDLDVPAKNVRGHLPTILLTPHSDDTYPGLELPLTLAMTRAIGDFYMHTFGVTWKPEVKTWDLASLLASGLPSQSGTGSAGAIDAAGTAPLEHLTLILASDGVWDLYEDRDVFKAIVCPPDAKGQTTERAREFFKSSVELGADIFGSAADNMTGIVVYLNPEGTRGRTGGRPDVYVTAAGGALTGRPSVAAPAKAAPPPPPVPPPPVPVVEDEEDCEC